LDQLLVKRQRQRQQREASVLAGELQQQPPLQLQEGSVLVEQLRQQLLPHLLSLQLLGALVSGVLRMLHQLQHPLLPQEASVLEAPPLLLSPLRLPLPQLPMDSLSEVQRRQLLPLRLPLPQLLLLVDSLLEVLPLLLPQPQLLRLLCLRLPREGSPSEVLLPLLLLRPLLRLLLLAGSLSEVRLPLPQLPRRRLPLLVGFLSEVPHQRRLRLLTR